jgi:fatty-acyl-CoA synthase
MRLVDDQGKMQAHDGETQGSLQVRGHWIVDTYYLADQSSLTADGWFDTGDIATIDSDGYLIIRDRAKDIIKSGGEWISTVELENIAVAYPDVAAAAVIAARHEKWDERPVLVVVPVEGKRLSEEALLAFYASKVAKWQIPDKVLFVDALPIGGTGKILKNVLREQYSGVLLAETKD